MAQGRVIVNNLNLGQGDSPEIERKALFIGVGTTHIKQLQALNSQSDLDEALGPEDSDLKTQVTAAQANGGPLWQAWAMPVTDADDWEAVADSAMDTVSPELIVVCKPVSDKTALEAMNAKAIAYRNSLGRRIALLAATPGIDAAAQTWADYLSAQAALVDDVAAPNVCAVPQVHGNDLGVLAGRLCDAAVSIADSPMRYATGPVLGLGAVPKDSADVDLSNALLASLDALRLSCSQTYPDVPGVYWGDANTLDAPGGDYQKLEHLRVVNKAARAVYLRLVSRVGNRALNNSPLSEAFHKTFFAEPLLAMAKSTTIDGQPFPGEIQPPDDDAITLVWNGDAVTVYVKVQPYTAPATLTANIFLDLNA